jgi:ABC-type lipoprotein release transport system permease subunit
MTEFLLANQLLASIVGGVIGIVAGVIIVIWIGW